jgi:hypothetical protein
MIDGFFVFIFSVIYSLMEIEIEGEHGWCEKLPTAKKFYKDFTFYHILMNTLIIMTFIRLYINKGLFITLFYTTSFFLIEDFLWFVLNPCFTLKKYTKENIPWHKEWFMGIPSVNFVGLGILFLSILISKHKYELFTSLIIFIVSTTMTILLSPFYHRFYYLIRTK